MEFKTIWTWLSDPRNQKTLAFLGGSLVVVWAAYQKTGDEPKPPNPVSAAVTQPAATQPAAASAPGNANNNGQPQEGAN